MSPLAIETGVTKDALLIQNHEAVSPIMGTPPIRVDAHGWSGGGFVVVPIDNIRTMIEAVTGGVKIERHGSPGHLNVVVPAGSEVKINGATVKGT